MLVWLLQLVGLKVGIYLFKSIASDFFNLWVFEGNLHFFAHTGHICILDLRFRDMEGTEGERGMRFIP